MDKIKYLPLVLFSIATLKLIVFGANYPEALTLMILAAASLYHQFHINKSDIKKLQEEMNKINKEHEEIKTHVSGLKLGQQIRMQNVR